MSYIITPDLQKSYALYLLLEEKSPATIEKYTRDLRTFAAFVKGREVDKQLVLDYKIHFRISILPPVPTQCWQL